MVPSGWNAQQIDKARDAFTSSSCVASPPCLDLCVDLLLRACDQTVFVCFHECAWVAIERACRRAARETARFPAARSVGWSPRAKRACLGVRWGACSRSKGGRLCSSELCTTRGRGRALAVVRRRSRTPSQPRRSGPRSRKWTVSKASGDTMQMGP